MRAVLQTFLHKLLHQLRLAPALAFALLLLGMACALPAQAEGVDFRDAHLAPREEGWALEADFEIELPARLEDCLLYTSPSPRD